YLFFFSSRRRHTRFSRDWSSDVCSSDLKYKTVCWCIDFGKFWIVVWWHNQWRKPALSSIGKVFKVYESTPKFEISHQKQSHCYKICCFCSVGQKLLSCVKGFIAYPPFFSFVHQYTSCIMFCR